VSSPLPDNFVRLGPIVTGVSLSTIASSTPPPPLQTAKAPPSTLELDSNLMVEEGGVPEARGIPEEESLQSGLNIWGAIEKIVRALSFTHSSF